MGAVLVGFFSLYMFFYSIFWIAGLQSNVHIKHTSVAAVLVVTELRWGAAVEGFQTGDFGLLSNWRWLSAAIKLSQDSSPGLLVILATKYSSVLDADI